MVSLSILASFPLKFDGLQYLSDYAVLVDHLILSIYHLSILRILGLIMLLLKVFHCSLNCSVDILGHLASNIILNFLF